MSNQTLVKQLKKQVAEMQDRIASLSKEEIRVSEKPAAALPFKGFDRLASSDRKGSLKIIRAQSAEALRAGIAAEKKGRGRKQVIGWMEETLARLDAGLPAAPRRGRPAGKKTAKPPVEGYDSLPEDLIVSTVSRGFFDDRLQEILAYEQAGQARKGVLKALKGRTSGFKGAEPWPGYKKEHIADPSQLSRSFAGRSTDELRKVASAEARQPQPSQAAIAAAEAMLLTPA